MRKIDQIEKIVTNEDMEVVPIPTILHRHEKPLFYVINNEWQNKDYGFGPFKSFDDAGVAAIRLRQERVSATREKFHPRVVRVDGVNGRYRGVKVANTLPTHVPIGNYTEETIW